MPSRATFGAAFRAVFGAKKSIELPSRCTVDPAAGGLFPRGAICRGRCSVGYVADGRLKQKCRKDGAWSGSVGRCLSVSCPKIEVGK